MQPLCTSATFVPARIEDVCRLQEPPSFGNAISIIYQPNDRKKPSCLSVVFYSGNNHQAQLYHNVDDFYELLPFA